MTIPGSFDDSDEAKTSSSGQRLSHHAQNPRNANTCDQESLTDPPTNRKRRAASSTTTSDIMIQGAQGQRSSTTKPGSKKDDQSMEISNRDSISTIEGIQAENSLREDQPRDFSRARGHTAHDLYLALHQVKESLSIAEAGKQKAESEMMQTNVRISQLQTENRELKCKLVGIQGFETKCDTQIARQYKNLCDDVDDWVDTAFEDVVDFISLCQEVWNNPYRRQCFEALVSKEGFTTMCNYPDAQTSFFKGFIHRVVEDHVFKPYLFGAPVEVGNVLSKIEQNFGAANPHKALGLWRAETMRAVLNDQDYTEHRRNSLEDAAASIWYLIEPLVAHEKKKKFRRSFSTRVLEPASALAVDLRTSPAEYFFLPSCEQESNQRRATLHERDIGRFDMVDVRTEAKMTRSSKIHYEDGFFGTELCVIHPALKRRGKHGEEVKLCKATLLVNLLKAPEDSQAQQDSGSTISESFKKVFGRAASQK